MTALATPLPDELAPTTVLRRAPSEAIWSLAWPVIALGLLRSGYQLAGAFWSGRLGDEAAPAMAALGGAAFASWIISSIGELPSVGAHALVARAAGAGERGRVAGVVAQAALLSLLLGGAMALCAGPLARGYFAVLGYDRAGFELPASLGASYLTALLSGSALLHLHGALGSVYRGLGDTRTPLVVTATTLLLNAGLDPFLMLGWGGLPRMGLAGAGWATVLASGAGVLLYLRLLWAKKLLPSSLSADREVLGKIASIGLPTAVSGVGFCIVYVVMGNVITAFGPAAMAGLGLGHRLESPSYQVSVGFAAAASTLVGQRLGARDGRGATGAAHLSCKLASLAMVPFVIAFVAAPTPLLTLFSHDDAVIAEARSYLFFVGLTTVMTAFEVVYEGAFAGAGVTAPAMIVVVTLTAARIPLAYALSSLMGLSGVWLAIALSTGAKGILLWAWFAKRARAGFRLGA